MNEQQTKAGGRDYRETLFLPQTDFPMRAGLPRREPSLLEHWQKIDVYRRMREAARGREKFILHDGPPYANGHLHMGHALNKILKDVVTRSQQMMGRDSNYVPGWDCHGLPIEWKIEERYREKSKDKDEVPVIEFRKECREFAEHWIGVQSEEFQRLGCVGDWQQPYTTMAFASEARIAREIMKFADNGQLYRGSKPVMWSVVERTALAEAEVEYLDYTSTTIWVRFPIESEVGEGEDMAGGERLPEHHELYGASIVIWTTTPWTIPGNRAIAYSPEIDYGLYEVTAAPEDNWVRPGDKLVLADSLAEEVREAARIGAWTRTGPVDPAGLLCSHPLSRHPDAGGSYSFLVPVLSAGFVGEDQGTGFVHIAPGHGADDFELGTRHGIEVPFTVGEDGIFMDEVPLFAGARVIDDEGHEGDANSVVIEALIAAGMLVARGRLRHQYPHSWRSKKPIIFRNTPQWFISMEDDKGELGLRAKALRAIDETRFVPPGGQRRLRGMIVERPDWVISRQRAWGVPIVIFVNRQTGDILRDEAVDRRILEAFEAEGADAWFVDGAKERFLGGDYEADEWEKVDDILDVWFESGCTHAFVLETRDDLKWPASLYLEGSDQHRGWFHSSLLESCGTRGRAPYEAVLTHGFTMDEQGRKMSKSLGNQVFPQDVIASNGADILRVWVMSTDYAEDQRIGPEILRSNTDAYRRLRNTMRFMLGNLAGFGESERVVDPLAMPGLERYILHQLAELDRVVRTGYDAFDFKRVFSRLFNFATIDLSAFYFDIRKDSLYCDPLSSPRRRACRTVLDQLFTCLTTWLAPMLVFTMDEAWLSRFPDQDSVHLRLFPEADPAWRDDVLAAKWARVRALRRVVTGALEVERRDKRIGASLEAAPVLYVSGGDHLDALEGVDLAEICITSQATVVEGEPPEGAFTLDDVPGAGAVVHRAEGRRCSRSWKILPEVGSDPEFPDLSPRDAEAVREYDARRA